MSRNYIKTFLDILRAGVLLSHFRLKMYTSYQLCRTTGVDSLLESTFHIERLLSSMRKQLNFGETAGY